MTNIAAFARKLFHHITSSHLKQFIVIPVILVMVTNTVFPVIQVVQAEGSKELVSSGSGKRAITEWRTNTTAGLYRRTFFRVYALAGENILMGSSAVGVGSGDIVLYPESAVSNSQIDPTSLATITTTGTAAGTVFKCSTYRSTHSGAGVLNTRAKELAGPLGNSGGYTPCIYTAPTTGTYWVAMYGPDGASGNSDGQAGTIDAPVIDSTQKSGVSMWDITVRSGDALTGTTKPGRVYVDYLAQFAGGNNNPIYSTLYAVTIDGYVYRVDLNGVDPAGYIFYGNRVGFLDPDGKTPLYHDVVYTDNTLATAQGGVLLAPASAKIFFNNPLLSSDLPASILPTPVVPNITNMSYSGSANGNTGYQSIGGTFNYTGNVGGISEIIIQGSGSTDFEPDNPLNRRLLSQSAIGTNSITWDGKDNNGNYFPIGTNYPFKVIFHAGEYHFPLLDAENSLNGGPEITLLNPFSGVCPFNTNCHTAFYDDRVYKTSTTAAVPAGYTVGTTLPGDSTNSINPPTTNHSDQDTGFDTSTAQRAFGGTGSNGFGNWKALDLWAYYPVSAIQNVLNVINPIGNDLRIVKSHSGMFSIGNNGGSFSIDVRNVGTAQITGTTTVTDTLPTGLTLSATPTGTGWTCTGSAGTTAISCRSTATIASGSSYPTITVNVNVSSSAAPSVTNTAVVANSLDSNATNNSYSDTVTVAAPDLTVTKTDNTGNTGLLGTPFNWLLTVANSGTLAATFTSGQTILSDQLPAGATYGTPTVSGLVNITNANNINCSIDASKNLTCVASGGSVSLADGGSTFIVTVPTTPTVGGSLANTATVDPNNNITESNESNNSGSDTVVIQEPKLNVVKSSTTTAITAAGQTVPYTFTVTNTGNIPLSGVTVTDPKCDAAPVLQTGGDANTDSKLDLAETWVYQCSHTVTQAEVNAGGNLSNTVTADSTESEPTTSKLDIPVTQTARLSVVKSSTTTAITAAGQSVPYTFTVTNTGNIPLNGVTVTDPKCDAAPVLQTGGDTNTDSKLDLTETWVYQCSHTVTQAEINVGGNLSNTVTADSVESEPATSKLDIPVTQTPKLSVVKSSTTTAITSAGQSVPYTFTVTNTGNETLSGITVTDPKCDAAPVLQTGGDANTDSKLDLTETWVYKCSHTVTQAEVNAGGNLSNTVTADSTESEPTTSKLDIPVTQTAKLNVVKSSTTTAITAAGQTVPYTFTVTNTGNIPLSGVTVTDPKCDAAPVLQTGGDANTDSKLDLSETWVYQCSHTVTQAEVNAGGNLSNTVTADSVESDQATSKLDIPVTQTAKLNVVKSSTTTAITAAGQSVPYTFTVTNTGNIPLNGVTVTDPKCDAAPVLQTGGDANTDSKLDLTETWVYKCSHTVTQAEVNTGGNLSNTVTADSTESEPTTSKLDIPVTQTAKLSVVKSSTTTAITAAGQTVPYVFTVTNTGNIPLNGVTVTDPKCDTAPVLQTGGDANTDSKLDLTETWVYQCSHTVSQAEVNAGGNLSNTVTADSTESEPTTSKLDISITQTPKLNVVKSSTTTAVTAAGQTIPYTFTVTNTGNETLSGITVTDPKCDAAPVLQTGGDANTDSKLDLTETWVYKCSHTVTQAEINVGGNLSNTVTADSVESDPVTSKLDIPVTQTAQIAVDKSSTTTEITAAGQSVPYTFLVTNPGNVILSGVTVDDPNCTPVYVSGDTNGDSKLDLSETWTYSCSHTVTQAEMDAGGKLSGTVTADSTESGPATDDLDIPISQTAEIAVDKSSTTTEITAAGQSVPYTFLVTNPGNVTLSGVTVDDPNCTPVYVSGDTNGDSKLDLSETWTYSCSHTVTQAEMDAGGKLSGTVTADSTESGPATDDLDIPISQTAEIAVDKSSTTTEITAAGQSVPYTFLVTNPGNVTLSGVTVDDPNCTPVYVSGDTNGDSKLDLSETWTYSCSHTVTQAEMDAGGKLSGTVTADSTESGPATDDLDIPISQTAEIAVDKSSTTTEITAAGQSVPYTFLVTNPGNVTLSGVTVDDPNCTPVYVSGDTNGDGKLDLSETWTYSCSHTVTQAEMDAGGKLSGTVTADSTESGPATDDLDIPISQSPAITLSKEASTTTYDTVGQSIGYTYTITNSGNVTLAGPFTVADDKATVSCDSVPAGGLAPLSTLSCSASYTISQSDIDAGSVTNTATASGSGLSSNEATATVNAVQTPAITLSKEASPTTYDTVGQSIGYTYTITNSGNVTLAGPFTVADDKATVSCDSVPAGGLAPLGTLSCAASYTISQADIDAGSVTNNATASGSGLTSNEATATVNAVQSPAITMSKEASPTTYDTVGQSIGYSYTITNSGNITLAGPFTVADDKATVSCDAVPAGGLAPLSTLSCSASYTISQSDIESGSVTNKATASGSGVSSDEVQATVNAVQNPELTLEKTGALDMSVVSPSDQANVGDKITYTFKVTNSGNMTLYNINLTDLVSGVSTEGGPISSLAPGVSDSATFTGTYTLTAADIINGSFTNNASISGETKAKTPVSASDDDTREITQVPSIALTKVGTLDQTVVDPKNLVNPGDKITYAFTVKNTGNLDLSNVTLSDALPGVTISGGPIALLHPGEEDDSTFTGVYAVTQDDIDAGKVENSATASGIPAVGAVVTDTASDTRNISNDPIIGIAKQITPDPVKVTPGTWDVTYSILVKNYGNVVLNKVQVTDDLTTVFPSPTTFVVQSISSTDLTVDSTYDGTTKTNLLAGTDTLAIGGSGTITVVVRVVPASSGPFNNTAVANAESSDGDKTTTDQSQVGLNPDPDDDGNPANNNDPTPTSFGDHPFDPPAGTKTVDSTGNPNMVWSMVWINNSNIIGILSEVHDPIPEGTTFVPNLVDSGYPVPTGAPLGSSSYGVACSAGTSTTTITTLCYYEGPTTEHPLGQVIWAGTLAPDLGVTDPAAAENAIHITFTTTNDANIKSVTNSATIDADLNGNGSLTDDGEQNVATASAGWQEVVSTSPAQSTSHLPITGFAPGIITKLPDQPKALAYSSLGEMWIEIPTLNMQSTVVGVPVTENGWDVSWLGKSTGWLNGTAYPTHLGNSVLTAHINDTNGHPGPFASIDKLKYGDQIIIHAWNQKYIYEVRETKVISATNNNEALKHQDLSWITLLTCRDYDEKTDTYLERYLVRAVLIKVQ